MAVRSIAGILALVALLAYLRDPPWLLHLTTGLGARQTDEIGEPYRWAQGRASLFVPSGARSVALTMRALKDTPGKNTYVVGGAGLVASLMDADLIDELRLIVHPVVVGSGKPLFNGVRRHSLEFVQAQPSKSGRVILTYRA